MDTPLERGGEFEASAAKTVSLSFVSTNSEDGARRIVGAPDERNDDEEADGECSAGGVSGVKASSAEALAAALAEATMPV